MLPRHRHSLDWALTRLVSVARTYSAAAGCARTATRCAWWRQELAFLLPLRSWQSQPRARPARPRWAPSRHAVEVSVWSRSIATGTHLASSAPGDHTYWVVSHSWHGDSRDCRCVGWACVAIGFPGLLRSMLLRIRINVSYQSDETYLPASAEAAPAQARSRQRRPTTDCPDEAAATAAGVAAAGDAPAATALHRG